MNPGQAAQKIHRFRGAMEADRLDSNSHRWRLLGCRNAGSSWVETRRLRGWARRQFGLSCRGWGGCCCCCC
jgi:hypothetical protein